MQRLVHRVYHANPPGGSGRYVPTPLDGAERYDPATGRWQAVGNLAAAREGHTATLLDGGAVLVVGGIDAQAGIPASNVLVEELYDPVSATWVAAGTSTVGSIANSATLLRDGTVLVAGGDLLPAQTPVDTVERFAGGDCR